MFHVTKEASHVVCLSVLLALPSSLMKTECPSGTYGATPGLTSPNCTGLCSVGYECPAGSDVPTRLICPAGFFCAGGPKQACPAGRYRYSVRPLDSSFAPLCSEAIAFVACPCSILTLVVVFPLPPSHNTPHMFVWLIVPHFSQ